MSSMFFGGGLESVRQMGLHLEAHTASHSNKELVLIWPWIFRIPIRLGPQYLFICSFPD